MMFMIGSWYNTENELRLLVGKGASLTISAGGSTSLYSPVRNAGPNGMIRLMEIFGTFREEGRNF